MKAQYDKNVYTEDYKVGQRVWVYFPVVKVGDARKLTKKFSGPFIITEKVRPKNFKVMRGHDLKPLKNMVHVDRLKPYVDRQIVPPAPEDLYQILDNESSENELDDLLLEDRSIEEPEDLTGIKESFEPSNEEEQTESNMDIQQEEQNQNHDDDTSKGSEITKVTDFESNEELGSTLRRSKRKVNLRKPILYSPSDSDSSEEEYEINQIIKGRYKKNGEIEYLIDWKGYPKEARTYEPYRNLNARAKRYIDEHNIPIVGKPSPQKND